MFTINKALLLRTFLPVVFFAIFLQLFQQGNEDLKSEEQILDPYAPKRIAIIGAGAGGSATAYYLQKYTNFGFDVTIFEESDYVGGRSTTIGNLVGDNETGNIELGASIFVSDNKILMKAVQDFNLTTQSFKASVRYPDVLDGSFGIWNGEEFIFESNQNSWWTTFKIVAKYGLSPIKSYRLTQSLIRSFLDNYYYNNFPYSSLNEPNSKSGFDEISASLGKEYLASNGISTSYSSDIIQAITRGNYIQNIDKLNGLGTMISLATDDTHQVEGGNWKIFQSFVDTSNATLRLNTEVKKITQDSLGRWVISYKDSGRFLVQNDHFDQVVIAAPLDLSEINISANVPTNIDSDNEFARLHVTIFSTKQKIAGGEIFNSTNEQIPEFILTTTKGDSGSEETVPSFYSINIVDYNVNTKEFIYKIFSPSELDLTFLKKLYSADSVADDLELRILKQVFWRPFPLLGPKQTYQDFAIADGLWYLNTMESFISTMETSCLAGANVAALISRGLNTTVLTVP